MSNYLWLIPLLPLLGAILNGFGALTGKLSRSAVNVIACGVVGLSFVVAVTAFLELRGLPGEGVRQLTAHAFPWIAGGGFQVDAALLLDPLSGVMILVVTGIGFLIHLYSTGYMSHEPSYARYFAYLNLFTFSMLMLVMGENMLMMFVGWEGVGACSYLLIGFWFSEEANAKAGMKAFVVNRVGDFGFLLGMFLLYWTYADKGLAATLSFPALRDLVASNTAPLTGLMIDLPWEPMVATTVCLLLFVGATGKSAQIPLYIWLPDAMAGPTPVSALIHAATMVTAGIYMICRLNFLFILSPTAMTVVACIGAATALMAATIGITQNDIKRVLAYSTVSQLGYMFMAVGLGAFTAGMFHLVTHAFFKACLFLGSGSVIHAMGGEQDMRKMGGLKKHVPYTYWTFLLATIAIAGIIPTSGFMSKDEILGRALTANPEVTLVPGTVLYAIGVIGALMTTFYMFRLVFMTFHGHFRGDHETEHHLHESPPSMVIPLVVLAFLSIFGGFLNVPEIIGHTLHVELQPFHHWLEGVIHEPAPAEVDHGLELGLIAAVQVGIFAMIGLAYSLYLKRPELPARIAETAGGLFYRLSYNKYYVDEIYDALIVRPLHVLSRKVLWPIVDAKIIDGAVNGLARAVQAASGGLSRLQAGEVNGYAFSVVVGMVAILSYLVLR